MDIFLIVGLAKLESFQQRETFLKKQINLLQKIYKMSLIGLLYLKACKKGNQKKKYNQLQNKLQGCEKKNRKEFMQLKLRLLQLLEKLETF